MGVASREEKDSFIARRRRERRKRKIVVCLIKGTACALLFCMAALSVCGVLFLREHLAGERGTLASGSSLAGSENGSQAPEDSFKPIGGGASAPGSALYQPGNPAVSKPGGGALPGQDDEKEKKEYVVVLDAGHGGTDGGTAAGAVTEKEINLDIVLKMKGFLESEEIRVVLTREADTYLALSERVEAAKESRADLFVSIHCNEYEKDSRIHGMECYYHPDSEAGKQLAETLCAQMEDNGIVEVRGAKEEDYYVLRNTSCTAVLVEVGYLSNGSDCKKLAKESSREALAKALSDILRESIKEILWEK